jgi:hypothetical protein
VTLLKKANRRGLAGPGFTDKSLDVWDACGGIAQELFQTLHQPRKKRVLDDGIFNDPAKAGGIIGGHRRTPPVCYEVLRGCHVGDRLLVTDDGSSRG